MRLNKESTTEKSKEYKKRQTAKVLWVLSRLFVIAEEIRNIELSLVRGETRKGTCSNHDKCMRKVMSHFRGKRKEGD